MANKQIVFLFPIKDQYPIGGFKIAYQYADFFGSCGFDVHFVYSHVRYDFWKRKISLFSKIKTFLGFYFRLFTGKFSAGQWFKFNSKVTKHYVYRFKPSVFNRFGHDAFVFATAVETALPLENVTRISKKNMFYLIQDYELWHENTDELIKKSYCIGLNNIVIAKWLQEKVREAGSDAVVIPNGLDFQYFNITTPIESRSPYEVCLLYHKDERKRCSDSLAALSYVKKSVPELHVNMFGNPDKPEDLPEWISYFKTPEHDLHLDLYNRSSVFVAASNKEGWALPPAEAMQCGAALVCTDIGGFGDYAIPEKTALTSPVYDIDKLAANIEKLLKNNELRIRIATEGNSFIQQFTLENSNKLIYKTVTGEDL